MKFRFGVDTFIWTENFSVNDLWIIRNAKELGFAPLDIAIAHPEKFPTDRVKTAAAEAGIDVVTTSTLNENTNLISPDEKTRAALSARENGRTLT